MHVFKVVIFFEKIHREQAHFLKCVLFSTEANTKLNLLKQQWCLHAVGVQFLPFRKQKFWYIILYH